MLPISTDHAEKLNAEQYAHITRAIENFGWSGPAFVQALADGGHVENRNGIKETIAKIVEQLADTEGAENAYRRRAARHVAYLLRAGLIAQDAGLVPGVFDMWALADKLWKDALASDSGPTDPNARALKCLVDAITARKDADIIDINMSGDDRPYREAVGFYDDHQKRYIIRESKFDELSGGFVSGRGLRRHLDGLGYLVKRSEMTDSRTWSGYPGLGKDAQYVVLDMSKIGG